MNCLLNNVRQEWKHLLMSFMKRTQGLDLTACRQNQNAREIRQTKSFSCLLISITMDIHLYLVFRHVLKSLSVMTV